MNKPGQVQEDTRWGHCVLGRLPRPGREPGQHHHHSQSEIVPMLGPCPASLWYSGCVGGDLQELVGTSLLEAQRFTSCEVSHGRKWIASTSSSAGLSPQGTFACEENFPRCPAFFLIFQCLQLGSQALLLQTKCHGSPDVIALPLGSYTFLRCKTPW